MTGNPPDITRAEMIGGIVCLFCGFGIAAIVVYWTFRGAA